MGTLVIIQFRILSSCILSQNIKIKMNQNYTLVPPPFCGVGLKLHLLHQAKNKDRRCRYQEQGTEENTWT